MVLQRIQTVYLLLAIALTVVFFFVPFGYSVAVDAPAQEAGQVALKALDFTGLIITMAVTLLFCVLALFSFRNLRTQKVMVLFGIIMAIVTVLLVAYTLVMGLHDTNPDVTIKTMWGGGGLLMVGTVIVLIAAYRAITADQRLLASYDRLR